MTAPSRNWLLWIGILLVVVLMGGLVSEAVAQSRATHQVQVLHGDPGNPDAQAIILNKYSINLVQGDLIDIIVDSALWCPGPGPASGDVEITVGDNDCGFTPAVYHIIEGGSLTQNLPVQALATVCTFYVDIRYTDADCNAGGTNQRTLRVNCNHSPAVSEWGMVVLTLLLLTAVTIVVGRRRRAANG